MFTGFGEVAGSNVDEKLRKAMERQVERDAHRRKVDRRRQQHVGAVGDGGDGSATRLLPTSAAGRDDNQPSSLATHAAAIRETPS